MAICRAASGIFATLGAAFAQQRELQLPPTELAGLSWDVVREDFAYIVQKVLEGALGRDLQASKDSGGRDPAVSYGDVQLHRHLQRFRTLAERLPARSDSGAPLGHHLIRLFVSAIYSRLQWGLWLETYTLDLAGVLHETSWTGAVSAGWPVLEVLGIIGVLQTLSTTDAPAECGHEYLDSLARLADSPGALWQAAESSPGRSPCALGRAIGLLAQGLAVPLNGTATERLLKHAQESLRQAAAAGPGGGARSYSQLFVPPLPSILSRAGGVLRSAMQQRQAEHVDIVYCGHLDLQDELEKLCRALRHSNCRLHLHGPTSSPDQTRTECDAHIRASVRAVTSIASAWDSQASTLLLSPFLWQWRPELHKDLIELLQERARWHQQVAWAGLPCLNRSRIFNWPVRRVRHEFWKFAYEEYATGYETSQYMALAQQWAVGESTSGTRVYRTSTLASLLQSLDRKEEEYVGALPAATGEISGLARDVTEWLVELDLLAKEARVKAHTLMHGASLEDDYKARAKLSPRLSRVFHIEAARFMPSLQGGRMEQQHCLFGSAKEAGRFTQTHGVVVSLCIRRRLLDMFRHVGSWWLSLRPRGHIIVPVSASVLNLFRGEAELFPWDADIDANFIANHPIVVGSFLEEHSSTLADLGYRYTLRGDRVVFMDAADSVRMDIWISGPQDVAAFDIRARLAGIRVNFFREQLRSSAWYYRPGEKIYGNTQGKLLHCTWRGHNACLPDCLRGGLGVGEDGCEFPDLFVRLDT